MQFWKNFKLGEEVDISGRFIYNGLRYFHEMESLYYEVEIFEVLYNLSVGLERLLKVAVVLIEHDDVKNQEEFEKTLITHSHLDLLKRVKAKYPLTLAGPHNEFLQMLGVFYKTHRYGRYGTKAMIATGGEKTSFHSYIEKHLKIKIDDGSMLFVTANSPRIRRFLGNNVGKITSEIYEIISREASRLNIYTYELRPASKASKIFLRKEYDFTNEDVLLKELLIYFVNSKDTSGHLGFIKTLEALEFDPALAADYIQCLGSDEKKLYNMDELEYLYEDVDNPGERHNAISLIGDSSVDFDPSDENDDQA